MNIKPNMSPAERYINKYDGSHSCQRPTFISFAQSSSKNWTKTRKTKENHQPSVNGYKPKCFFNHISQNNMVSCLSVIYSQYSTNLLAKLKHSSILWTRWRFNLQKKKKKDLTICFTWINTIQKRCVKP